MIALRAPLRDRQGLSLHGSGARRRRSRPEKLGRLLPLALLLTGFMGSGGALGQSGHGLEAGSQQRAGSFSGKVEQAARLENGESVRRDLVTARTLYCNAARQGDARAALALAWQFINGRGVPRDDHAASFWLHKAAARNIPQAANLLRLLGGVAPIERGCATPPRLAPRVAQLPSPVGRAPQTARVDAYREAIDETAQHLGLNPKLLSAMIVIESGYNTTAVSPKGALGLMQLMPATAQRFNVSDAFDYRENLRGGAMYLRSLLDRFGGNVALALAAYNAGEGAVISHRGIPPFGETHAYITAVTQLCECAGTVPRPSPAPPPNKKTQ